MDLVSTQFQTADQVAGRYGPQDFLPFQDGSDWKKVEPGDRRSVPLDPMGVFDPLSQHLESPAEADHLSPSGDNLPERPIKVILPQQMQVLGDILRSGKNHDVREPSVLLQRISRPED